MMVVYLETEPSKNVPQRVKGLRVVDSTSASTGLTRVGRNPVFFFSFFQKKQKNRNCLKNRISTFFSLSKQNESCFFIKSCFFNKKSCFFKKNLFFYLFNFHLHFFAFSLIKFFIFITLGITLKVLEDLSL